MPTPYDPETFRQQGHALIDQLADYLSDQLDRAEQPVLPPIDPEAQAAYWAAELTSAQPPDLAGLLQATLDRSLHLHHPRNLGHQVAAPLPLAALVQVLTGLLNNGMAVYETGPASSAQEQVVLRALAQAMGFSADADGVLTSGGTLANLTALLCARRLKAQPDVWQAGQQQRLALMVSAEAHYCVDRAARIMGWGEAGVIKVPTDDQGRMRSDQLPACLTQAQAEGLTVIAVVGSACSTATGSYDDLSALADFCAAHDLWLHVDGAHGAAAALSLRYRALVAGLARADSVAVDFHKMMLLPAPTTALLFGRGVDSYRTFAQEANYLWAENEAPEWYNYAKRTFECTKRMMGTVAYLVWRMHGPQVFAEQVETTYDLARAFAAEIEATGGMELALPPQSNIVCFRCTPADVPATDWDALNARLRAAVLAEGRYYLVQTRWRGQLWLRCTLMNPATTLADLQGLLVELQAHMPTATP